MIWLNNDITFRGNVLCFRNWIRSNILFIGDIVSNNRLLNNNEIKAKLVYKDGRWLSEYARVRTAIKQQWIKCIKENEHTNERDLNRQTQFTYPTVQLVNNEV